MPQFVDFHTHSDSLCAKNVINVRSYRVGHDCIEGDSRSHIFTAGIHPWDAQNANLTQDVMFIERLNPDAIGEIGLDYVAKSNKEIQLKVFVRQVIMAKELKKPIVVHCVGAFEDVIKILSDQKITTPVAFHGYIGSPEQTKRIIDAGYFLSFGNNSFKSPKTKESFRLAPKERILLETDESSNDIEAIYRQAICLLNIPLGEIKERIFNNYKTFFGL